MHESYAIWMIGGLQPDLVSTTRDREQRTALRESRRTAHRSLFARLRGAAPARAAETDLVCCAA